MGIDLENQEQVLKDIYHAMANDLLASTAFRAVELLAEAVNDPAEFNGGPENLELWLENFGSMTKWEMEVALSRFGMTSLKKEQHEAILQRIDALQTQLKEWQSRQSL